MKTMLCGHFPDTVAVTYDQNSLQSDFVAASFCCDDKNWSCCICDAFG